MKKILNKISKAAVADMPRVEFPGRIIVIDSEAEADRAVEYLLTQPILGLDTETKPSFQRGRGMKPVALLQVSTTDTCFLFRLCHIGIPDSVVRLLSDRQVLKVGLSWQDDLLQLRRRRRFQPGEFLELQRYVGEFGIQDLALQKIYANVFGQKISKSQRLTNWEADTLSDGQKHYAAIDAWACVRLYQELSRMKQTGDYVLEVVPEETPSPETTNP